MNHLANSEKATKIIIGHKEKIDFPELRRTWVTARIDTGARSSSAHCDKIWVEEKTNGTHVLCCYFLKNSKQVTRFSKFHKRKVKSSNGASQVRYVVRLLIRLGKVEKLTEVTLTDRSTMNYSVLLGRRFLSPEFLVDVSRAYIATGPIKQKK